MLALLLVGPIWNMDPESGVTYQMGFEEDTFNWIVEKNFGKELTQQVDEKDF